MLQEDVFEESESEDWGTTWFCAVAVNGLGRICRAPRRGGTSFGVVTVREERL